MRWFYIKWNLLKFRRRGSEERLPADHPLTSQVDVLTESVVLQPATHLLGGPVGERHRHVSVMEEHKNPQRVYSANCTRELFCLTFTVFNQVIQSGFLPDGASRVRGSSQSWSSCGSESSSLKLSGLQIITRPQTPRLRPPDPKHTLQMGSCLQITRY